MTAAVVYFAAGVPSVVTLSMAFAGVAFIAELDERKAKRLRAT